MAQISKRQLGRKLELKVYDSFWRVIANIKNREEVSDFFSDCLTRTERVYLAKRMAIAVLLSKGYDYRSISNMLKVSTGTVGRVASKIEEKGWKLFVRKLEGLEDWDKFWHDMEKLLMRFTGAGRRMFLSGEEIEGIVRKHKRLSS